MQNQETGLLWGDKQTTFPLWVSKCQGVGSHDSSVPSRHREDMEPGEGLKNQEGRNSPPPEKQP